MPIREISSDLVQETVELLFLRANLHLPEDIQNAIRKMEKSETSPVGLHCFHAMYENMKAADELQIPICQDTGMAVVFLEIGQDVHLYGMSLEDAVNTGVAHAYLKGGLRCSVVSDPLKRINTGDNAPAILHTQIVPGNQIKITAMPKGFGSENMSAVKMFTPAASTQDLVDFAVTTMEKAGSNPCPPVVMGIGIGGNFEYAPYLAKKALCRPIDQPHENKLYAGLEEAILYALNRTGIGPQGFGGNITALGVNIEVYPTHIAGLPVAVNIGCHVSRHMTCVL